MLRTRVLIAAAALAVAIVTARAAGARSIRRAMRPPGAPAFACVAPAREVAGGAGSGLRGCFLPPMPAACHAAALLLFAGRSDAPASWLPVQAHLARAGVASLLVPGLDAAAAPSAESIAAHARASRELLLAHAPGDAPLGAVGYSLGGAAALALANDRAPGVDAAVAIATFSTARDAFSSPRLPSVARGLLPAVVDNIDAARRAALPLLVVHGTADSVLPVSMGRALHASAPRSRLLELEGGGHELPFREPLDAVWRPVVDFVAASAPRDARAACRRDPPAAAQGAATDSTSVAAPPRRSAGVSRP